MSSEITPSRDNVRVSDHILLLRGIEDPPPAYPGRFPNGLVAGSRDGAIIITGVARGPVDVTVELADAAPPLALDEWEEVAEISVESTHGSLHVFGLDGDLTDLSNLASTGPGQYRIRIHARGRDTDPDGTVRTPVESYLIASWPSEAAPELIYKQTDRYGQALRRI
ncbi:hypothetical protein [Nonomuraea sp. NPDC050202]|jgi:hypothetical protein|uniref:hypothetical protein n=1 Tax=Nonomuraea sp. NPDC050202 TaxID=3155035 RepID=UPI0033F318F2